MKILAAALLEDQHYDSSDDQELTYQVYLTPSAISDSLRIVEAILFINREELFRSGIEVFDTPQEASAHAYVMFMDGNMEV